MKIWDALCRVFRKVDKNTAKAIDVTDPEKAKQIIEDAEREADSFEHQIAILMASKKVKEKKIPALESNIKKYDDIAVKANAAGNQEDLRDAVTEKLRFQSQLNSIKSEIKNDSNLETRLRKQLSTVRDTISNRSSEVESDTVRQSSAKIRQSMANSSNSFSEHGNALASLDNFKNQVNQDEAMAEAMEELAGDSTSNDLEEKYLDTSDVDAEMAKYSK